MIISADIGSVLKISAPCVYLFLYFLLISEEKGNNGHMFYFIHTILQSLEFLLVDFVVRFYGTLLEPLILFQTKLCDF